MLLLDFCRPKNIYAAKSFIFTIFFLSFEISLWIFSGTFFMFLNRLNAKFNDLSNNNVVYLKMF